MRSRFFYDLGSPEAWLVAERVNHALPEVPAWKPIHLPGAAPTDSAALEARARALGLPPVRWPTTWPVTDTRSAMLAAAFAQGAGRGVAFSLAAFRQAFLAGRDLADPDTLVLAGAACELHPRALLKGMESRATRSRLEETSAEAARAGVRRTPALVLEDGLVCDAERLEALLDAPGTAIPIR